MRLLGVELRAPGWSSGVWVWGCAAGSLLVGLVIHSVTQGNPHLVFALGAAGAVAGLLVASGAHPHDAGWQGGALCFAGAVAAFVLTAAVATAAL